MKTSIKYEIAAGLIVPSILLLAAASWPSRAQEERRLPARIVSSELPRAAATIAVNVPNPTSGATYFVSTSAGTITTTNSMAIAIRGGSTIGTIRPPKLSVTCDEESCVANAWTGMSMENARAMLERVANRGIKVEVLVHDAACHVQRETIEPKPKEDLVAAR